MSRNLLWTPYLGVNFILRKWITFLRGKCTSKIVVLGFWCKYSFGLVAKLLHCKIRFCLCPKNGMSIFKTVFIKRVIFSWIILKILGLFFCQYRTFDNQRRGSFNVVSLSKTVKHHPDPSNRDKIFEKFIWLEYYRSGLSLSTSRQTGRGHLWFKIQRIWVK